MATVRDVNGSELAVALADHLAWPVVVLALLAVLGGPLRRLIAGPLSEAIKRMRTGSVKAAGVEVDFSAESAEPEEAAAEALEEELRPQVGQQVTPELIEGAVRSATEAVRKEWQDLSRLVHAVTAITDAGAAAQVTRTADGGLRIEPARDLSDNDERALRRQRLEAIVRRQAPPTPQPPRRQVRTPVQPLQHTDISEQHASRAEQEAVRRTQDAARANAIAGRANAAAARGNERAERENQRAGRANAAAASANE
jgi:hypothetical protein